MSMYEPRYQESNESASFETFFMRMSNNNITMSSDLWASYGEKYTPSLYYWHYHVYDILKTYLSDGTE